MKIRNKIMLSLVATAMIGGCVTGDPERAYQVRQPKTQVVRTFTSFSDSLRCMDDLFLNYGIRGIVITSNGIPDATDQVSAGTRDMLISAISRMSVQSKAFKFVDFDQEQENITNLQELVGFTDEFQVPSYYIRGAITQLDEGVLSESVNGSLARSDDSVAVSDTSLDASKNHSVSVISTDMNLARLVTRQIMPGISASNSIVVRRSGVGGDVAATIDKVDMSFEISLNKRNGLHQATRTLIELSAIEIVGKLARVPYWRCLKIEQTNPHVVAEAREWYRSMSRTERVAFVKRALAATGDYRGPANGTLDQSTRRAIGRYQARRSLIANGRIDFDLYKTLIAEDLAVGTRPAAAREQKVASPTVSPLRVSITTPKGPRPAYKFKESLAMTVATSRDAHLYCYYGDASGNVIRVFPNKFSPESYVVGGQPTAIPGQDARFGIVFDTAGVQEEVLCVASERDVGLRLPDDLRKTDLAPLPVRSLDKVITAYRKIDPTNVAVARLPIRVTK